MLVVGSWLLVEKLPATDNQQLAINMLFFTKPNCFKCEYVLEYVSQEVKDKLAFLDITSPEGRQKIKELDLTHIAKKTLPIVIDDEGNVYDGAIECRRFFEENSKL